MRPYISGIDVGTSSIKVFSGLAGDDGNVTIAGSGSAPVSGFAKGEVVDAAALAHSVRQAVDCAQMASNIPLGQAFLGISGIFLHSVNRVGTIGITSANGITEEDVERAKLAAVLTAVPSDRHLLHVLPISYRVDGIELDEPPVGENGNRLEVDTHIVTAPKVLVDDLIYALSKENISVLGMVANGIVGSYSVIANDETSLFMDIGAGTTDILLYKKAKVVFSVSMPFGGGYITSDLMKVFGVTEIHAEEIKRYYSKLDKKLHGRNVILDCNDYGTTDKKISYDLLFDVIESRVAEIISFLFEHLQPLLWDAGVKQIYLTGGCVQMPSFAERIGARLKAPVQILRPEGQALEYQNPVSTACFGVLNYTAGHLPQVIPEPRSKWPSFLENIKARWVTKRI